MNCNERKKRKENNNINIQSDQILIKGQSHANHVLTQNAESRIENCQPGSRIYIYKRIVILLSFICNIKQFKCYKKYKKIYNNL
jgi:hypothetical protein